MVFLAHISFQYALQTSQPESKLSEMQSFWYVVIYVSAYMYVTNQENVKD